MISSFRDKETERIASGQFSIRVNTQYRICFFWIDNEALHVELTDYH